MLYRCNIVIAEYRNPICSTNLLLLRLDAPATVLLHRQDPPRGPQHALRYLQKNYDIMYDIRIRREDAVEPKTLPPNMCADIEGNESISDEISQYPNVAGKKNRKSGAMSYAISLQ